LNRDPDTEGDIGCKAIAPTHIQPYTAGTQGWYTFPPEMEKAGEGLFF
jgi:hypothetical protein